MSPDASQIKERIMSFLGNNGPSIPVHIAHAAGQSILFTSAFLSELLSDRMLKISNMRVGSSPIYFIPGQEPQLEKFSNYLKSKEKEAYILLKEKNFLEDTKVEPAIRVALRAIKDFAVPFEKEGKIIWRYFIIEESSLGANRRESSEVKERKMETEKPKTSEEDREIEENSLKSELNIFDNSEDNEETFKKETDREPSKTKKSSSRVQKKGKKEDSKFFNKVKEFLSQKSIEIVDIEEIGISRIIFRVKNNEESKEYLIVAYNKKRIAEEDITKAYKKAESLNLEYQILCFGDTPKKIENMINAAKNLKSIEKVE